MVYSYTKNISKRERHEVVVCGGGFSGFAAAYAAAREGADVILVEKNFCLGGVGTGCLVNHLLGGRRVDKETYTYSTCVGDIFLELEKGMMALAGAVDINNLDLSFHPHGWLPSLGCGLVFDNEKMKLLLERMLISVGVRILYGTELVDVVRDGEKVSAIIVHNKSGFAIIEGERFVDATGDADLCFFAGCEFKLGDEEGGMSAASLEMHVENVDREKLTEYMRSTGDLRFRALINPLKESGEWDFPYDIFISVMLTRDDVFMINTIRQVGVDGTDADSLTEAAICGREENFRLLDIMRKYFPGFENATVREIAPCVGIRETRRIVGEYTLSVADLVESVDFSDGIALSGYGWDMPHPKNPSVQPFEKVKRRSPYTQIPYRCLVPRGVDNVICVGRSVSVEREVLGPVRVMAPCIAMGTAAGIASAELVGSDVAYRSADVQKLRQKIVSYGGIVDRSGVR